MKKGRGTDHREDEWDNENITVLLLTVEDISVPPCLVSFFFFLNVLVFVLLVVLVVVLGSHRSQRNQKHRETRQLRN